MISFALPCHAMPQLCPVLSSIVAANRCVCIVIVKRSKDIPNQAEKSNEHE